jgi:hydroxyacylglutathione hydrolase
MRACFRPVSAALNALLAGLRSSDKDGGVKIHVLPAGPIQTNAYLLTNPSDGTAVLIDAPGDVWAQVEPILRSELCLLEEVWLTHGHWDHTQGGAEVVAESKAVVRAHPADRILIETPEVMDRFAIPGIHIKPVKVDHWLKDGERLKVFGTEAEVRHVPGHAPGNVLFYFKDSSCAFVGDALFFRSVGRTDLPGGDFATLEESIRGRIYTLPNDTVIYPGHGPETTVGEEKKENPHIRG